MDSLSLLGCFGLRRGAREVRVSGPGQRVLAYLAVHGPTARTVVAGTLWPDVRQERADGSLRTTVWRLSQDAALKCRNDVLELPAELAVDTAALRSRALELLAGDTPPVGESHGLACGELLPGWGEDWVRIERERLHQLRLHALESLVDNMITGRRHAEAMAAASLATGMAPLRESAHRAVIAVHLAQGDLAHAVLHFRDFEATLRHECGLVPSTRIRAMLAGHI
ncbi:AfsR/SARP family transcriptional regulator [Kutzneria sp. CA-103260]|uniref:AfsR/SARP family transcriptional regulator n=1 Tax=Kutzneria sp. CA-103260 TaxID=2802641 RepID=UPI001BA60AB1|nr:BTAD domain-containing putative transcriptional regulator [Kutzneria sp. CA-103260]QUQ63870.1 transcriptional regulator [Kutzneria sp. CA-103260]